MTKRKPETIYELNALLHDERSSLRTKLTAAEEQNQELLEALTEIANDARVPFRRPSTCCSQPKDLRVSEYFLERAEAVIAQAETRTTPVSKSS